MLSVLYQWQEWSSTLVLAIGFDIEPPQAELLNALLEAIPDWPPRPFDGEDGAPGG